MTYPERLLLGPGPSNIHPRVAQALSGPLVGHLDPVFLEDLDELSLNLQRVFRTNSDLAIAISATGSGGMETIVSNFVDESKNVVVALNGAFSERVADMILRHGGNLKTVGFPWGQAFDPEKVAKTAKEHKADLIFAVHAETSTGVLNDVQKLGSLKGDSLLAVDCVTSLGGVAFEMDAWGIDIAYSATQKCLSVPPGLAPICISQRASQYILKQPRSWYFDLNLITKYALPNSERRYHHTAPIPMLAALGEGLRVLLEQDLELTWQRHIQTAELLWQKLSELGFELPVEKSVRLPSLTLVELPEELAQREAEIRKILLNDFSIEVGAGLGKFAGKYWRIGLMGYNAQPKNVIRLTGALKEIMS